MGALWGGESEEAKLQNRAVWQLVALRDPQS